MALEMRLETSERDAARRLEVADREAAQRLELAEQELRARRLESSQWQNFVFGVMSLTFVYLLILGLMVYNNSVKWRMEMAHFRTVLKFYTSHCYSDVVH